jgi:hypothetical protein
MRRSCCRPIGLLTSVVAAAALAATSVAGQAPAGGTKGRSTADVKPWAATRTAWGDPDLQGIWDQTTGTPLERPRELAGKEVLSDAEAVEREQRRFAAFDETGRAGGTGDYGSVWREGSKNALNRTSLIVDPNQFTIDDPAIYTRPWTVSLPMVRGTEYFEYACHEGNYGLPGILGGARAEEKVK